MTKKPSPAAQPTDAPAPLPLPQSGGVYVAEAGELIRVEDAFEAPVNTPEKDA